VNGDSLPDLLVADSQSNDVQVLPGVGGEFFDDRNRRTLPTGATPRQLLVGEFDGLAGLDLVSINFGSNDATLFPEFGPGRAFATGGDGPVAAVAGDFNSDGRDDLFVVHNGDGQLTLLLGEGEGFSLGGSFTQAGLHHPTDVVSATSGEGVTFYLTEEGREAATPFVLTFLLPDTFRPDAGPPPTAVQQP